LEQREDHDTSLFVRSSSALTTVLPRLQRAAYPSHSLCKTHVVCRTQIPLYDFTQRTG